MVRIYHAHPVDRQVSQIWRGKCHFSQTMDLTNVYIMVRHGIWLIWDIRGVCLSYIILSAKAHNS
jgi:hypothetical protein